MTTDLISMALQAKKTHGEPHASNPYCFYCDKKWPCEPRRFADAVLDKVVAKEDSCRGCPESVWLDGIYKTRCCFGIVECHQHGLFETIIDVAYGFKDDRA